MVLLKCVTYASHCMHRCKRETSLSAISILRGIPQANKGLGYLIFTCIYVKPVYQKWHYPQQGKLFLLHLQCHLDNTG